MTKTISIRYEVYRKLLAIKREDESFSELFERLAEGANPIETLKELRGCIEFKDKQKMISEMYGARAGRRIRYCWTPMSSSKSSIRDRRRGMRLWGGSLIAAKIQPQPR